MTNNTETLAERLASIQAAALDAIAGVADLEELARVEDDVSGRESAVAQARRSLGSMPHEDRRDAGRLINETAAAITNALAARRDTLEADARAARIEEERIDVTVDHMSVPVGTLHPLQQVIDEVCDIFVGLGYRIAEGPEAELAWYNFDALNTPPDHPGRMESDTMYVDYGPPEAEMLMRTQTSPIQARSMELQDPPIYVVAPGKVYRNDTVDATHLPVFHQIEGLAVDEHIVFSDLKGTLEAFAREFFGDDVKTRFRPHYFPFTEPSAELDVLWGDQWLEMLGCGMVDPNVFTAVGYDPDVVTGFAFGMGVERLALVRHGIDSMRHFVENDLRFLRQF